MEANVNNQIRIPRRHLTQLAKHTISYLRCGPSQGTTTMVLIHGLPTSAELWRPVMYHLGQSGYCAFAPDLPGFGQTTCNAPVYASFEQSIKAIEQWVIKHNLRDIHWVGHQMGCRIALSCAKKLANRSSSLSLLHPILAAQTHAWPTASSLMLGKLLTMGTYNPIINPDIAFRILSQNNFIPIGQRFKKLDKYTFKKVLWNEKIFFRQRRTEFMAFIKALPNIDKLCINKDLRSVKVPIKILLQDKAFFERMNEKQLIPNAHELNNAWQQQGIVIDSPSDCDLFPPLEQPHLIFDLLMKWHHPNYEADKPTKFFYEASAQSPDSEEELDDSPPLPESQLDPETSESLKRRIKKNTPVIPGKK